MNYNNRITKRHPGLVIFMVDQSGLGFLDGEGGKSLAIIAADIINIVLTEMVNIATRSVGDDGEEEVRDYYYIYIFGYGGESFNNVNLLYRGFISDIANNYPYDLMDTFLAPLNIYKVIKPVVGYDSPMATAFEKVRECIVDWKNNGHNDEYEVSPFIMNVTHGETLQEQIGNSKSDIYMSASKIFEMSFPDGPPLICNIVTRKEESKDTPSLENQSCGRETFQDFFSGISSSPTDRMISQMGFEKTKLLLNINDVNELFSLIFSWGHAYAKPKVRFC